MEAALLFMREELLYDIRNCAYIEGDVMGDEPYHERHMVQDAGEAGNADRLTRVLDLAHAEALEMLYPYTKQSLHRRVEDDRLRERERYMIKLRLPEAFSQTTLHALEKLVHEYMVSRAMSDWLSITHPEKAGAWQQKAEDLSGTIRTKAMLRRGRVRIRQHPF